MSKQIIIIGGGISGLAALHFLRRKYSHRSEVHIQLLEKSSRLGGVIRSVKQDDNLYESGPNGFQDSATTRELIDQLGLNEKLVAANPQFAKRFIALGNQLYTIPQTPLDLWKFKWLSFFDKLRLLGEIFIKKGEDQDESVYDFGRRRFGEKCAQYFLDPMVSGIFGGDARQISLRLAFPKIYELEQTHGSLLLGLLKRSKKEKLRTRGLYSFHEGMETLVKTLNYQYQDYISTDEEVRCVSEAEKGYIVETTKTKYFADSLIVATPAYQAETILKNINPKISECLSHVPYAPIAVVGLVYPKKLFTPSPEGFGYLIPSQEQRKVLGVIFASQIFPKRCPEDQVLLQVMIGGAHHPQITNLKEQELVRLAQDEMRAVFKINAEPINRFSNLYPRAIPQYTAFYGRIKEKLEQELSKHPHLHLSANYLNGIGINDCIENAKQLASTIAH